jgi:hypothetical protein
MTLPKPFTQAVDLADPKKRQSSDAAVPSKATNRSTASGDLEQQWLDVASAWPPEPYSPLKESEDAFADLALRAGRTEQQSGIAGSVAPVSPALASLHSDPQSRQSDTRHDRLDLEGLIAGALGTDFPDPHAGSEQGVSRPEERQAENASAPASTRRRDPFFDDDRRGASATAPLDGVARAGTGGRSAVARRAPPRRGVASRTARSLALPLFFFTIAGGALALMNADPAAEGPEHGANDALATARPARTSGDRASFQLALGPAGSPDRPKQSAVPAEQPAEPVAAPSAAAIVGPDSAREVVSSGSGIALGGAVAEDASASNASSVPSKTQAADLASGSLSADLPPPARSPTATTPELAKVPPSSAAADPPAPPAPNATGNASQAEPTTAASAASTISTSASSGTESARQAVKKPVFANGAQSSAIATDRPQTVTAGATKPGDEVHHAARSGSDARNPSSVPARGLPDRVADASQAQSWSARSVALATQHRPDPAAGSSMWIGLASSSSESDARATLSQLQKKFPGQLGASSILRVERGGTGALYRVRVGPLSLKSAAKVCSVVRAAGKNCVLTGG